MKNVPPAPRRVKRTQVGSSPGAALSPCCKIWLERDGKVALSDWRVELLEAIAETGSLSTAAKRLHVPYRTAWYKLKDLEACLDAQLLVTERGGAKGGASHLTPEAQQMVRRFRRVTAGVSQLIEERFRKEFKDVRSAQSPHSQEDGR